MFQQSLRMVEKQGWGGLGASPALKTCAIPDRYFRSLFLKAFSDDESTLLRWALLVMHCP